MSTDLESTPNIRLRTENKNFVSLCYLYALLQTFSDMFNILCVKFVKLNL